MIKVRHDNNIMKYIGYRLVLIIENFISTTPSSSKEIREYMKDELEPGPVEAKGNCLCPFARPS
jgi:hypothetical protein